jgi:lipopolysaccharide biosynthesis protein
MPFGIQRSAGYVADAPKGGSPSGVKAVAFYLPQFHPIPENDAAWGEGFTEWRNVTRGQQEFTDHYQPRAPANYGYYDLRIPDIQVRQTRDAKAAGIGAFCYYYYWFDGRTPLAIPPLNHRDNPAIELPFCLCFANENWTKRWDGLDDEVIFKQTYGNGFAERFWDDVAPFLKSRKYLRDAKGRPILLVYRPSIIPAFDRVAAAWKERAVEDGFPGLHVVAGLGFENLRALTKGADSYYEFPPLNSFARASFGSVPPKALVHGRVGHSQTHVHDYRQFVMAERLLRSSPENIHPAVMPGWDNVARRPFAGNAFANVSAPLFEEWTRRAAARAQHTPDKLLFVNAWNEWAEGTYLEPDQRHGWAALAAFARGLEKTETQSSSVQDLPVAIFVHAHYADVWGEICAQIEERVAVPFNLILTTSGRDDLPVPKSKWLRDVEIHRVENRGRDILPFLTALGRTKFAFDIALKLHTKRSPHRIDGAEWRRMLVDDLLPPGGCKPIVSLFREDPNIGFVAPEDHWARIGEHIGSNLDQILALLECVEIDFSHLDLDTGRFIAGSMFWFRRGALGGLDLDELEALFVDETGQVDGTPAHAMERLFSLIGERNGHVTTTTDRVGALLHRLRNAEYPLQERMEMYSDQIASLVPANRIALSRVDYSISLTPPPPSSPAQVQLSTQDPAPANGAERIRRMARKSPVLSTIYRRLPEETRRQIIKVLGLG